MKMKLARTSEDFKYRENDTANPEHYRKGNVETIDKIWAECHKRFGRHGDIAFAGYCLGNTIKYPDRAPHKGTPEVDRAKTAWYQQMLDHVMEGAPDPRSK